jgi:putative peptidoglycan lipid II flippase
VLGVSLAVVTAIGMVAAPLLVYLVGSGFAKDPGKFDLTVTMLRICFPYILFVSLVSVASGILNTYGRFKGPAFTPVLLNLSFIAFIVLGALHFERPIVALAWAVFFGGLAQLLFQLPFLRHIGMLPRPRWDPKDEGVVRILKLMGPALLGVSVAQISLIINTNIATQLGDGPVSWLYYADRLMEFPSALLGVALGTILLPSLVKHHHDGAPEAYSHLLDWGLRLALVLTAPAAVALGLLALPLVATLFWHGDLFTRSDALMTRHALVAYAAGLAGIVLVKILAPGFYARQNVRTPVKVAIWTLAITQLLNLVFVPWLGHSGLALAISVGACFNAGWLWFLIWRSGHWKPQAGWAAFLLKLVVALYMMGGAIWYSMGTEASWFEIAAGARAARLAWVIAAGTAAYFASLALMGLRLRDFARHG